MILALGLSVIAHLMIRRYCFKSLSLIRGYPLANILISASSAFSNVIVSIICRYYDWFSRTREADTQVPAELQLRVANMND